MNYKGIEYVQTVIGAHPDRFDATEFGSEGLLDCLTMQAMAPLEVMLISKPIKASLSLASWVVILLGDMGSLFHPIHKNDPKLMDAIWYRKFSDVTSSAIGTSAIDYATKLLEFDAVEDIVLSLTEWPETWWNTNVPFNSDRYWDHETEEIPQREPTAKQVVATLERMMEYDKSETSLDERVALGKKSSRRVEEIYSKVP